MTCRGKLLPREMMKDWGGGLVWTSVQSAPLRPEDRRAPHRIQLVPRTTRTDLSCCQQREAESGCFSVFFFFVALRASPLFTPSRGGVGPCVPRAGEKQISDLEFVAAATFRRLGGFFFFSRNLNKDFFFYFFFINLEKCLARSLPKAKARPAARPRAASPAKGPGKVRGAARPSSRWTAWSIPSDPPSAAAATSMTSLSR